MPGEQISVLEFWRRGVKQNIGKAGGPFVTAQGIFAGRGYGELGADAETDSWFSDIDGVGREDIEITQAGFGISGRRCGKTIQGQGGSHQPTALPYVDGLGIPEPELVGIFIGLSELADIVVLQVKGGHVGQGVVGLGRISCVDSVPLSDDK